MAITIQLRAPTAGAGLTIDLESGAAPTGAGRTTTARVFIADNRADCEISDNTLIAFAADNRARTVIEE